MRLFQGYNESTYKAIARKCDNAQLVKDVGYASFLAYHNGGSCAIYAERVDDIAFILCQKQRDALRIIGLGTAIEARGGGLASYLLKRAEAYARREGLAKVHTRSQSGVQFYAKRGYDVIGMKEDDYLLEKTL